MNIKTTIHYEQLSESEKRISVFQGGTRSNLGNTRVLLSNLEEKCIDEIKLGDEVVCLNSSSLKLELKKVDEVFAPSVKEAIEISLRGGKKICSGLKHKYFIITKTNLTPVWKEVKDLTKNDFIACPRVLDFVKKTPYPLNTLKLIGFYLADGYLCEGCVVFDLTKNHKIDFLYKLEKNSNLNFKIRKNSNGRNLIKYPNWKQGYKFYFNKKIQFKGKNNINRYKDDFSQIIHNLGLVGTNAHTKFIPSILKLGTKKELFALISGLFNGDGWVDKTKGFIFCTASEDLFNDVKIILIKLELNFSEKIRVKKYKNKSVKSFEVILGRGEDLKLIYSKCDLDDDKKKKLKILIENKKIVRNNDIVINDICFKKIKSIKSLGKKKMYDFSVGENSNYIGNQIITHNSGKTYNILTWWILKLLSEQNKTLTICRLTMGSLKNTVFLDFKEILENLGLWETDNFFKSEMVYQLNKNRIEFKNLDDDMKIRGAKRDYLYINEANEISQAVWKQLIFRTTNKIILDYNPSSEFHWIYDEVIPREDADFQISTYLDNPFLSSELVKEIERLKDIDPNYWRVYGLGERGIGEATIFPNWELWKEQEPQGAVYYGLDFGFNHPSTIVKTIIFDGGIYSEEIMCESGLTTADIIDKLLELGAKEEKWEIYADCSRPEIIQEIYRVGINIHPTIKGANSVRQGIDYIKRNKLFIEKGSTNLIKELKSYSWKTTKDGRTLDEPVKLNDDCIDAMRYSLNSLIKPKANLLISSTNLY